MTTSLFSNSPNAPVSTPTGDGNEVTDYVEHFTKDGKAPTVEDLAKGKYHADKHIQTLESTLAGLRKELDTRLTYEEVLEQIRASQGSGNSNNSSSGSPDSNEGNEGNEPNNPRPNQEGLRKEDLASMVRDILNQESQSRTREQNIRSVVQELQKTWGPGYESVLAQKANELNASPDFLNQVAASNPKAFFQLVGVSQQQQQGSRPNLFTPPTTSVNSAASDKGGTANSRRMAELKKMRKEDPRAYWSPAVQREIMKIAAESGGRDF